jgi:phage terminase small subunit
MSKVGRKPKVKDAVVVATTSEAVPMPPDYLDAVGEEMWFRICAQILEMGLLTEAAFPQVADYCFNWQIFVFNAGEVKKDDTPGVEIYSTGSRGLSANFKAATDARKSMVTFERYWGLNPMSLAKINLPAKNVEPEDEFDL